MTDRTSMDVDDIIDNLRDDSRYDNDYSSKVASLKADDYARLKSAWVAERMSPELLMFEGELLDRIMDRVRSHLQFIEENTLNLDQSRDMKLRLLIVESELERVKFLIRGYLRVRLAKIDKHTAFIMTNDKELAKLAENERTYLDRHAELLQSLYHSQFLNAMPESLQRLDDDSGGMTMIEAPDMDRAVFVKVVADNLPEQTIGNDVVDMEKNSVHIFRYRTVEQFIKDGSIVLI